MSTERSSRAGFLTPVADEAPTPEGIGATISARLAACVSRLEDPALPGGRVVHEVRKELKRVRALLRLSSDALPTRHLEKRCAEAARRLAHLRDADAMAETLLRLRSRADARHLEALDALSEALAEDRRANAAAGLPRPLAEGVVDTLRVIRADVDGLDFALMDEGTIGAGLADAWAKTARAFRRVLEHPVLPRFHDFRKVVKRELYQRELCGMPLDKQERAMLKKLADVLGELQDLDVLRAKLRAIDAWQGPVRQLVKQTIRELKARALRLGLARYPEGLS
ncbi:CHAD domain-containing protein [Wenzhouxiangella sp. XN24]|uniref:CHAD domain-containing protein n=1 Tax=Wenzhouxiangella sp. XN24 TaxID=2713569 RepID=UPI0013ECEA03|nr:CHAD domain-containing protein [Wenzhouxiangella sp. XN24]NGX15068.1 CHAD domain-containing protein [Wenzhouxiangella sp. XN24]